MDRKESELEERKAAQTNGTDSKDEVTEEGLGRMRSDWTYRAAVAEELGRFLKASYHRAPWTGTSGRSKAELKNTISILIRDKEGNTYTDPVRAFRRFQELAWDQKICGDERRSP